MLQAPVPLPPLPELYETFSYYSNIVPIMAAMAKNYVQPSTSDIIELTKYYQHLGKTSGELAIRQDVANAAYQYDRTIISDAILKAISDGDVEYAKAHAWNLISLNQDKYSVEKKAYDAAQDSALIDTNWGPIVAEWATRPDKNVYQIVNDLQLKSMQFQAEVEQLKKEASVGEQGYFSWALDFLGALFHPHESVEKVGAWWSAGDEMAAEMMELRATPAGPEFDKKLQALIARIREDAGFIFDNKYLRAQYAIENNELFRTSTDPDLVSSQNFWSAVNTLALLPLPKVATIGKMFSRVGNKSATAAETLRVLAQPLNGTPEMGVQAVRDLVALRAPGEIPDGVSRTVRGILENNAAAIATARSNLLQPGRLTQAEEIAMRSDLQGKIKGEFGDSLLHDVDILYDPDFGGISVRIQLGTKQGVPYTNKTTAHSVAKRKGFKKGEYEVVESPNGGYIIQLKRELTDTGYINPYVKEEIGVTTVTGSMLRNPSIWVPRGTGWLAKFSTQLQRAAEETFREVLKPIASLGYFERKKFNDVMVATRNRNEGKGMWMELDELSKFYEKNYGRLPKDKEIAAYYAYKQASDFEWSLRNEALYKELYNAEYKEVVIDGYAMLGGKMVNNGKVVTSAQGMDRIDRVYDATTDSWHKLGDLDIKSLEPQFKTLVKLYTPAHVNKHPVKLVIVDTDQLVVNPLAPQQLKYAAGGHRMYEGRWFVKQLHVGQYPDGGKYIGVPRTIANATTKGEAQAAANGWNMVIDGFKEYQAGLRSAEEFDSLIKSNTNMSGIDDFLEEVKRGHIDETSSYEVFFDREPTFEKALAKMHGANASEYINATGSLDAHVEWYNSTGRMYYSARHEPLYEAATHKDADVLDALDAINKSAASASNTWAYSTFKTTEVERWVKSFSHMVTRESLPPNPSPYEIFRYGIIKEEYRRTNPDLYAKATAMRGYLNRIFGTPSQVGERLGILTKRIAEKIESIGPTKVTDPLAEWLYSKVGSNPQGALKGLMYDFYLGMLNPGQFLLQAMGAVNAVAIHPIYGLHAGMEAFALRAAMMNTDPKVWDRIAAGMATLGDLSKAEYLQLIKDYRNTFLNTVGREQADLDLGINFAGSHLRKTTTDIRLLGRIPVNEGERMSRSIAYGVAWRDWKDYVKKNNIAPEIANNPRRRAEYALARAEEYMQSMTTADATWWQRAPGLGLATQFFQYPIKLMENLFWPGKNKMFSGRERLQMVLGQGLLFGAAGIPFGQAVFDWYLQTTGQELSDEQYKTLTTGLMDKMIREVSDGELDPALGNYFGSGNFFPDLLWSMFGDKTFAEVAGGATIAFGQRVLNAYQNVAYLSSLEQTGTVDLTDDIMSEMFQLFTSTRQATKAYYLWKYGIFLNNTGSHIEMNKWNALLVGMNYPLSKVQDTYKMFEEHKNYRTGLVKDLGKMLSVARIKAIETGNERHYNLIQALLQPLSPTERKDVIDYANRIVPKDMYTEALKKQIERGSDPVLPGVNKTIIPEAYR